MLALACVCLFIFSQRGISLFSSCFFLVSVESVHSLPAPRRCDPGCETPRTFVFVLKIQLGLPLFTALSPSVPHNSLCIRGCILGREFSSAKLKHPWAHPGVMEAHVQFLLLSEGAKCHNIEIRQQLRLLHHKSDYFSTNILCPPAAPAAPCSYLSHPPSHSGHTGQMGCRRRW